MDLGLTNRRALVTGASLGLGKAIAKSLSFEGASVAICARDPERVHLAAREIGAVGIIADLNIAGAVQRVLTDTRRELGGIDILIINTGGPPATPSFDAVTDELWRSAFEGIWISAAQLIRGCLPQMRDRGWGRILMVTSVSAREPLPNLMLSNALRPGLHGMLNALSREVAKHAITVNAIMPGYTLTERLEALELNQISVCAEIPAGRLGRPEEFAALATFLASDCASYISGQAIACDGGLTRSI